MMTNFYYEYKYLVEDHQQPYIISLLKGFYANTDPYPEGWLQTIYYDSIRLDCYNEALNGSSLKRKFRTRSYMGSSAPVQLQVKDKNQLGVQKYKCSVRQKLAPFASWSQCLATIKSPDAHPLRTTAAPYGPLLPVMSVSYFRQRFRAYDCRINLDSHIRFEGRVEHPASLTCKYSRLPFSVLEIKTTQERPYLPFMGMIQLPQVSLSKFALGMGLMNNQPDVLGKYL